MHDALTAAGEASRKVFAQLAHVAAHEVLTLRELRQRAVEQGVQSLGDLNQVLEAMIAERARFMGAGWPDVASDALERAAAERLVRETAHA
jgi:hypothetical protein